jgi:coenzyme F420-reducing hydrogenase alpha subunit
MGLPSALPLLTSNPAVVDLARALKGLGNRLCDAVAGRTTHPVSIQVGGMAMMPDRQKLAGLAGELRASVAQLAAAVELFKSFDLPDFVRPTEFVSLEGAGSYPWIGGKLTSSDGVRREEHEYRAMTNEFVDQNNTSKWCKLSRESFAVGALARVNNNFQHLCPEAKAVAGALGLSPVCHNPFMNNVAQLVEVVHVVHESLALLAELASEKADVETMVKVTPRAGVGVSAVEVPRGILYHCYEYGADGRVVRADCVIPTTQNNLNIHLDLRELARQYAAKGRGDRELELLCSMLVRAYDPCVSCSVH